MERLQVSQGLTVSLQGSKEARPDLGFRAKSWGLNWEAVARATGQRHKETEAKRQIHAAQS